MSSVRDEKQSYVNNSLVDKDFLDHQLALELQEQQNRSNCCSPYVAIFLGLVYVVVCFLLEDPDPACARDPDMRGECDWSYWSSLYALDFFIFGVAVILTLHLWLVGREEYSCLAFSCLAFGFMIRGFVSKYAEHKGYDDTRYHPIYYIATMVYYVFWTIAAVFLRALIERAWERTSNKPRLCGVFQSGLALLFVGFFTILLLIGGILSATVDSADMIFNIGRISWHIAYFVYLCGGANTWGALASEQTVKVWGLPNSFAGNLLIFFLVIAGSAWIVVFSWENPVGSFYFAMLAYFGLLMTVFFTHNALLSVIIPMEIFADDVSIMSDTEQARDFSRSLEKPMANDSRKWQKRQGDDGVPDTESSSFESIEDGKVRNYDPDFDDPLPTSKPLSLLMFFSMFRPRDSAMRKTTNENKNGNRKADGNIFTKLGLAKSRDVQMVTPAELDQLESQGEIGVSRREVDDQIIFEKFSSASSVAEISVTRSAEMCTTQAKAPIIASCGFFGWSLLGENSSRSTRSVAVPDVEGKIASSARSIPQGDEEAQSATPNDDKSFFAEWWDGFLRKSGEKDITHAENEGGDTIQEQEEVLNKVSKSNIDQDLSEQLEKSLPPVASISFSSGHSTDEGFMGWFGSLFPKSAFANKATKDMTSNTSKASISEERLTTYDDKIEERVIREIENSKDDDVESSQSKKGDTIEIPRVLTVDRCPTKSDSESVVSQLTGPLERKSATKKLKNVSQSDSTVVIASPRNDAISLKNTPSSMAQGKYKSMLRNSYSAAATRSANFEEATPPETTRRVQSETSVTIGKSTSSAGDVKESFTESLGEETRDSEPESIEVIEDDVREDKDRQSRKSRRLLIKRPGFWPKRSKTPKRLLSKQNSEDHIEPSQDMVPEKGGAVTLLDELLVHMYMTETEDEEDNDGIAHLMKPRTMVEQIRSHSSVTATFIDEIVSTTSSDTDYASSTSFTSHTRGLDADLDIAQSESDEDTSLGSSLESSTSADSSGFFNQVMETFMPSGSQEHHKNESSISVVDSDDKSDSRRDDETKQMKVRAYTIEEYKSHSSDNSKGQDRVDLNASDSLSMKSSSGLGAEDAIKMDSSDGTKGTQDIAKEELDESVGGTTKKNELFLVDLSGNQGDHLDTEKLERAPSIHTKDVDVAKARSLVLVHLPSGTDKYGNGLQGSYLERAVSYPPPSASQHKRKVDGPDVMISKSTEMQAETKTVLTSNVVAAPTNVSEQVSNSDDAGPSIDTASASTSSPASDSTTKPAALPKRKKRSSRRMRKSLSKSSMALILSTIEETEDECREAAPTRLQAKI